MLREMILTDFLSFGPGRHSIELRQLNVLIGPNGSGKSNFVEALSVLRAVPRDLPLPIRKGGGVVDWLWRGRTKQEQADRAGIEVVFSPGLVNKALPTMGVRYRLAFGSERGLFVVLDERLENESAQSGYAKPYFFFGYESGRPVVNTTSQINGRGLALADMDRTQSVLSQFRDSVAHPEISSVGDAFKKIAIYRSWSFGPDAPIRESCRADVENHLLLEDFSNLPARLAVLKREPETKRRLLALLAELSSGYKDIEVIPEGGRLQLYVTENGRNIPASRLSDGTLRYLALTAVLLEPGAELVVIEEPELGLHPDMFPTIRDLLIEASERVQLVVTTHSTLLLDALTEHAESVIVCEKTEATSKLRRLVQSEIDEWKHDSSLGLQWLSGTHGGTRW